MTETAESLSSEIVSSDEATRSPRSSKFGWWTLAIALIVWAASLHYLAHSPYSQWGLLFTTFPVLAISAVLITVSFVVGIRSSNLKLAWAALAGIVIVERWTTTLITTVPMYAWTYKHIGVVDYIQVHGRLASGVDVYNGWPGVFAATAWFCDLTGASPITVAHSFTIVIHAILVLLVYALVRAIGQDRRVAVIAAFLSQILDWVGQDYFSPQAVALLMALGVILLLIQSKTAPPRSAIITVIVFAGLTCTHQLTPFWVVGVAVLLAITRRLKPAWLALILALILAGYVVPRLGLVSRYGLLSGFNPLQNAQSNMPTGGGVPARSFSITVDRTLAVAMWFFSAIGAVVQWRRKQPIWIPALLAFSPIALLGSQSYGGEAIFRVFLYAVPGCSLILAPLLARLIDGRRVVTRVVTSLTLCVTMLAGFQAYFGTFYLSVVDKQAVVYARQFFREQPAPALFAVIAAYGWPDRVTGDYVRFAQYDLGYDRPLVSAKVVAGSDIPAQGDPLRMDQVFRGRKQVTSYLIIPSGLEQYAEYYGLSQSHAIDRLQAKLADDPWWTTYYKSSAFTVYKYTPVGPATTAK